jgi:hypothetical protein
MPVGGVVVVVHIVDLPIWSVLRLPARGEGGVASLRSGGLMTIHGLHRLSVGGDLRLAVLAWRRSSVSIDWLAIGSGLAVLSRRSSVSIRSWLAVLTWRRDRLAIRSRLTIRWLAIGSRLAIGWLAVLSRRSCSLAVSWLTIGRGRDSLLTIWSWLAVLGRRSSLLAIRRGLAVGSWLAVLGRRSSLLAIGSGLPIVGGRDAGDLLAVCWLGGCGRWGCLVRGDHRALDDMDLRRGHLLLLHRSSGRGRSLRLLCGTLKRVHIHESRLVGGGVVGGLHPGHDGAAIVATQLVAERLHERDAILLEISGGDLMDDFLVVAPEDPEGREAMRGAEARGVTC